MRFELISRLWLWRAVGSADGEQLDVEDQCGVGRDGAGVSTGAVREVRRDGEFYFVADFHAGDAEIPAADDLFRAEDEGEGLVAIDRAVELGAVDQPASIMDGDGFAALGRASVAGFERFDFQVGGAHGKKGKRAGVKREMRVMENAQR
jgi:hypothetical protein